MGFPALLVSSCLGWFAALVLWLGFDRRLLPSMAIGIAAGTGIFFALVAIHALARRRAARTRGKADF